MNEEELIIYFKKLFKCDGVRISSPLGETKFLIIGHTRNTREDLGVWIDSDGNERHWDYLMEQCIASGKTDEELINSANVYKELSEMSMEEYLETL